MANSTRTERRGRRPQRGQHLAVHAVDDLLPGGSDWAALVGDDHDPARRSAAACCCSASPAASRSSSVTTIVVLSRSDSLASSIWVSSPGSACIRTQCPRTVIPISASAAVSRVLST